MSTGAELLLERVRAATEDEYTIEGELGRGGMAAVFLARDKALERRVAIKVMLPDLIDVAGIEERFVIEARTAAHLDHAGIVTVYSVKQRGGLLFIVMKYIEGRTLEGVIKAQGALDASVVTTIVSKVAEALQFAHGEGIIHRDVKPSNIIIDTRGRPVVTDFGIAKVTSAKSMTVTGSMLGTPTYMSPEQCRGLPATAASDQYSLGVMMYEMLTGRVPFGGTIFELIHAHCHETPAPLADVVQGLDPLLVETVTRMLAKSPADRWESLTEVARRLSGTGAQHRSTSQVNATIAAFARADDEGSATPRSVTADLSNAATEVATTPAPALVVTPVERTIEVGQTVQMRVSESSGASLAGVRITWRSEDPTIATVDETGLVTGRSAGFAKITATGGAALGRVAVTVTVPSVDTLVVTPQSPELITDNEIQFVATALDSRGLTLIGQTVVWQSSDVSVCAVSSQGRAIGIAPGKAVITAMCGDVRGTAQARVKLPAVERVVLDPGEISIEADETRRFAATVYGADDRKLTGRKVTWRSTVPGVATVDAEGTVRGIAQGTAAIIATCDGKDGLASIGVRSQPIVAVRIQPEQLHLETGRSLQLKGVGEDRSGRSVSEKGLVWQSDDERIALVDASGKVHAVSEGQTTVRALAGDVASSIHVTVVPRAAVMIRIDPHEPKIPAGETLTLHATVFDGDDVALVNRAVTWSSSNPAVVTVQTATGVCEAKKAGSVVITAACERVRTTTKLGISAAVLTEIIPAMSSAGVARSTVPEPEESAASAPATRPKWLVPAGAGVLLVAILGGVFALRGAHGSAKADGTALASAPAIPAPAQRIDSTPPSTAATSQTPVPPPQAVPAQNKPAPAATEKKAVPPSPEKKAVVQPPSKVSQGAPGGSGGTAGAAGGAGTAKPPVSPVVAPVVPPVAPPAGSSSRVASPPARTDSAVTPPAVIAPPVTPPANAPPARTAPADAEGARAALCANGAMPASLLSDALATDLVARLTALYQPRDAADTKAKTQMLNALKDAQNPHATVRTVRNETSGDGCDWLMTIEFSWNNAFGQTRKKSFQARVQLEMTGGSPHIKHLFGATSQ